MTKLVDSEFGTVRSILWPIHRHELKKLLPMLIILFLICFNYTALRNMKDSVLITAAGAEVIPFIKVWAVLPMAVIATLVFTKLSNRFSQEQVFYMTISVFLSVYLLFAFVLYPFREALHPTESADFLQTILPSGLKGLVGMYRHWTFTGFYVMSELWSTMVMTVLFWGFANEVTRLSEARRFYGVFGIASNFAAIAASQTSIFFGSEDGAYNPNIPFGTDAWEQTMMMLVSVIVLFGLITMGLFYWINRNVLNDPSFTEFHQRKLQIKSKKRLSLRESFTYLSQSKYLICIAVLVVAYNLVINLVEVVWKDQLRTLYPLPSDYNMYINHLTSLMGIVSTLTAFFMAKIIGRLGWTKTALFTPIIMLLTTAGFFSFIYFQDSLSDVMLTLVGASPLAIAVFFGSAQNCLSKAAKYSFFDTTKEMAFIPLDHESKLKGKAAIDGVGSRLGKSGGALIHQGLLLIFSTLAVSTPYVATILMAVIGLWIYATRTLGVQFNEMIASRAKDGAQVEEWQIASSNKPQAPEQPVAAT